jgi:hypothetical protein
MAVWADFWLRLCSFFACLLACLLACFGMRCGLFIYSRSWPSSFHPSRLCGSLSSSFFMGDGLIFFGIWMVQIFFPFGIHGGYVVEGERAMQDVACMHEGRCVYADHVSL